MKEYAPFSSPDEFWLSYPKVYGKTKTNVGLKSLCPEKIVIRGEAVNYENILTILNIILY